GGGCRGGASRVPPRRCEHEATGPAAPHTSARHLTRPAWGNLAHPGAARWRLTKSVSTELAFPRGPAAVASGRPGVLVPACGARSTASAARPGPELRGRGGLSEPRPGLYGP